MVLRRGRASFVVAVGCWIAAVLSIALVAVGTHDGRRATTVRALARGANTARPVSSSTTTDGTADGNPDGGDSVQSTGDGSSAPAKSGASTGPTQSGSDAAGGASSDVPIITLPGQTTTTTQPPAGPGDRSPSPPAVSGRVVDELGLPVANECVIVDSMWLLFHEPSTTTGADGRFAFSNDQVFPPGKVADQGGASVIARDCSNRLPGFQTAFVHIDPSQTSPVVTISVALGAAVVGSLVDAQGVPLSGYCVHVGEAYSTSSSQHAVTDVAGHFTINGVTPGVEPIVVQPACGSVPIDVVPAITNAIGLDTMVLTVPAAEDAFSAARVLSSSENPTMHTIGATLDSDAPAPSCLPGATRTVWRILIKDQPGNLVIDDSAGSGAVAVFGADLYGHRGPEVACATVGPGQQVLLPFGGLQGGLTETGSQVEFEGWWVELASGPTPIVIRPFA